MIRHLARSVPLVFGLLAASNGAAADALPPITTVAGALAQLRIQEEPRRLDALENLAVACKGKYRRDLRDRPELEKELTALFAQASDTVKTRVLDAYVCFSAARFSALVIHALDASDPVVAHAAEIAARLEDPALVAPLLDRLDRRATQCLEPALAQPAVDACVWLTYASGSLLTNADAALKKRAGDAARPLLKAPHAKLREVAAETVSASGRKR
jgi:hypothetical protein